MSERPAVYHVATYLSGLGLVSFPESAGGEWPAYVSKLPHEPDRAVRLVPTGGNPLKGAAALGFDEPTFQIVVRGAAEGYEEAWGKARALYGALQGVRSALIGELECVLCQSLQTDPVDIGEDEAGRPRLSLNFALHCRAVTQHRQ